MSCARGVVPGVETALVGEWLGVCHPNHLFVDLLLGLSIILWRLPAMGFLIFRTYTPFWRRKFRNSLPNNAHIATLPRIKSPFRKVFPETFPQFTIGIRCVPVVYNVMEEQAIHLLRGSSHGIDGEMFLPIIVDAGCVSFYPRGQCNPPTVLV